MRCGNLLELWLTLRLLELDWLLLLLDLSLVDELLRPLSLSLSLSLRLLLLLNHLLLILNLLILNLLAWVICRYQWNLEFHLLLLLLLRWHGLDDAAL